MKAKMALVFSLPSIRQKGPVDLFLVIDYMYKEENMIRISQLKLPVTHKKSDLEKKIYTTLKISSSDLLAWHIEKKSLDARKKPNLFLCLHDCSKRSE